MNDYSTLTSITAAINKLIRFEIIINIFGIIRYFCVINVEKLCLMNSCPELNRNKKVTITIGLSKKNVLERTVLVSTFWKKSKSRSHQY